MAAKRKAPLEQQLTVATTAMKLRKIHHKGASTEWQHTMASGHKY